MNIVETDRFRRSFSDLPKIIKMKAQKQFRLFLENIFHTSLHTEKLEPRIKNIWSFRLDRKYRVIFTFRPEKDEIWFLDVGSHDIYKR